MPVIKLSIIIAKDFYEKGKIKMKKSTKNLVSLALVCTITASLPFHVSAAPKEKETILRIGTTSSVDGFNAMTENGEIGRAHV